MRIWESIQSGREMNLGSNSRYRRIGPGAGGEQDPTLHANPGRPPTYRPTPPIDPDPPLSAQLLCPMPGVTVATDSLRQFYRQGIPQMRVLPPKPL